MKKAEMIEKLMVQEHWEDMYIYFARKGMQKSTKKELQKWMSEEE